MLCESTLQCIYENECLEVGRKVNFNKGIRLILSLSDTSSIIYLLSFSIILTNTHFKYL